MCSIYTPENYEANLKRLVKRAQNHGYSDDKLTLLSQITQEALDSFSILTGRIDFDATLLNNPERCAPHIKKAIKNVHSMIQYAHEIEVIVYSPHMCDWLFEAARDIAQLRRHSTCLGPLIAYKMLKVLVMRLNRIFKMYFREVRKTVPDVLGPLGTLDDSESKAETQIGKSR